MTGVSDWQGGHQVAKKLIQTALPSQVGEPDRVPVEVVQLVGAAVIEGQGELGRLVARLEADGGCLVDDVGGRPRVDDAGAGPDLPERRGRGHEGDHRNDDDDEDGGELAAAEWPDQAVALLLVCEIRAFRHVTPRRS